MSALDGMLRESRSMTEYGRRYAAYLAEILSRLDYSVVEECVTILEHAWKDGRTVFVAGNGGSAATASHWALDLNMGTRVEGRRPFRALSLADGAAVLTALGNDRGYADCIVGQLEGLFQPGDILVAISASGNSPNVLRATEFANAHGGITIGFVGFDGGHLKTICRYSVHVATPPGEYGPVEDIHLILDHMVTSYLRFRGAAATSTVAAKRAQ